MCCHVRRSLKKMNGNGQSSIILSKYELSLPFTLIAWTTSKESRPKTTFTSPFDFIQDNTSRNVVASATLGSKSPTKRPPYPAMKIPFSFLSKLPKELTFLYEEIDASTLHDIHPCLGLTAGSCLVLTT